MPNDIYERWGYTAPTLNVNPFDLLPSLPSLCSYCDAHITGDNPQVETPQGHIACKRCTKECNRAECSNRVIVQYAYGVGETIWCRDCTSHYSGSCDMCDHRYSTEDDTPENPALIEVQQGNVVCRACLVIFYWTCPCTNRAVRKEAYCGNCGKDSESKKKRCECGLGTPQRPIHAYSCKPNLVFHGKSKEKIHMGLELETRIGSGGDSSKINNAAIFAMERLQPPEIAELKEDRSIGGGFEIVTQPHTYEKYRDDSELLWDTIDTLRTQYKARSWDSGTCGLHIHISRNAFRDGLHTHNFIEFIYRNPEMLMKFAGRNSTRYATFSDCWGRDEYGQPKFDIEDKVKRRNNTERMSAVNVLNEHTIELRFMRGTMRPSGVRSSLGLAHAMVQYTRHIVPDVEIPREQVFAWEPFRVWVEERAEEYADLMERMPLIKDVNLSNVPNIDA